MAKYTYKNIIIDPTSEEAKRCLGKMVYFADNPTLCLYYANNNDEHHCGILQSIEEGESFSFVSIINSSTQSATQLVSSIILKEKPDYGIVPFDTVEEFVKASLLHSKNHYLSNTGIWLKKSYDESNTSFCMIIVSKFCVYDNTVFVEGVWLNLKEVLNSYTFLDGTPCGKIKE